MNYDDYYAQQVGGALPYFAGARVQRGHGIGSLFGGLLRSVAPLIKRGALALGNRALKTGAQIAGDILSGENIRTAAKRRTKTAGRDLLQSLHIAGSRVVEMMGRLHVDLFMQDRFLINGVTVKIRLVRSKDAFSLMAGGANHDYKVRIVDAVLFVRKAVLSPTVAMAHIRALEKGTAKYPLRPVDCKVYSIPQGALSSTHENLFLGTLPKRIILWCVDNDALNGAFGKNPFHAKNNAINFLAVYVDGRQVPAKPLQPNFETGQYVRSYVNLFSATGKQGQDEGNELTRDDFGNGYTFFGFDLTPDACDGSCFHLVQKGNLRIEIHFAAPLAQTVNVVVHGESEAVLEIDKGRNIIYDH